MERCFGHEREEAQALDETSRVEPCDRPCSSHCRRTADGYVVDVDFPDNLLVSGEEIALLRTFLSEEIMAILHDEEQYG